MKQVKTYLDCQNLEHTLIMLEDEKKKIREQEERLKLAEESIRKRMEHINRYREAKEGECLLKKFPDRYCLQLNEDFTRDEEVDFAIKRLQKRHEDKIRSLGDPKASEPAFRRRISKTESIICSIPYFSSWRMPNRIAQERKTLKIYGKTAIFFCRPAAI